MQLFLMNVDAVMELDIFLMRNLSLKAVVIKGIDTIRLIIILLIGKKKLKMAW